VDLMTKTTAPRPGFVARRDAAVGRAGRRLPTGGACNAWPEIVGAFGCRTAVRSVRDGLYDEVDDPGWATRFAAERQIVGRAESCCGPGVGRSIRVVVAGLDPG
jgi:hypothetical protein